ncbi:hypothetical protein NDU88_007396 [Pleurodeles waltl]|uniref:Uncharacterized protein n=1 Tax=Pleurodeles waltl TaxID=8319 RepID=A0AAV7VTR2_PLEWA|nr:hypothetical protein NDU88_007396 [Pleurodeles waltl]
MPHAACRPALKPTKAEAGDSAESSCTTWQGIQLPSKAQGPVCCMAHSSEFRRQAHRSALETVGDLAGLCPLRRQCGEGNGLVAACWWSYKSLAQIKRSTLGILVGNGPERPSAHSFISLDCALPWSEEWIYLNVEAGWHS